MNARRLLDLTDPSSTPGSARPWRRAAFAGLLAAALAGGATPGLAQTYYVDGGNLLCSASGPGTPSSPYCTISAALAAHHAPGTTILVMPGTYPEQVTVPTSGSAGSPILLKAMAAPGQPVVVDGSDDYSSPALWTPVSGDVWQAASVTWTPRQVFADGARLARSTASPDALPPGSFTWVSGSGLYVNVGGVPSAHAVRVGRRPYGFYVSNRAWVRVEGFTVARCEDRGIQLTNGTNNTEIVGNEVLLAGRFGIQASGCSAVRLAGNASHDNADHGISFTAGTTGSILEDNDCYRNVYPPAREANGIYLFGCPGNVIRRNRLHDNQDSGLQLQSGSNGNLCSGNLSWSNGDHGYDHLLATDNIHNGDVAWGNYKDGFSIEGQSTGQQLHNCIAAENGLTTNEFDLWVDAGSSSGFVSDYNVFWNSTAQSPIKYGTTLYASVGDYRAVSGEDAQTLQSNPGFVNPGAGDFRLAAGSPAIDCANSGSPNWSATDAAGHPRVDDPATPNRGAGPVRYADRGALEYVPAGSNLPPVASLNVTPSSGAAPLAVTADASGSSDSDGSIVSYNFDFGDGTKTGPQSSPTATHTYAAGSWKVTVVVKDNQGGSGSASTGVMASGSSANLIANGSFETDASGWAASGPCTMARVQGGFDGNWALELDEASNSHHDYGVVDAPGWVTSTPPTRTRYRFSAWVRSSKSKGEVELLIRERRTDRSGTNTDKSKIVKLSTGWQKLTLDYDTRWGNSALQLSVMAGTPRSGENFQVDAISLVAMSPAPAALAASVGPAPGEDPTSPQDDPGIGDGVAPNPFRTQARLAISLARPGPVTVRVFDLSGRLVRRLLDQAPLAAGRTLVALDAHGDDGESLRGGLYFYEVRTPERVRTGRFVIVR